MSDCHPRDAVYARLLLQSCATQWSVAVNMQDGQLMNNAVDALEGAALGLAAAGRLAELRDATRPRDRAQDGRTMKTCPLCRNLGFTEDVLGNDRWCTCDVALARKAQLDNCPEFQRKLAQLDYMTALNEVGALFVTPDATDSAQRKMDDARAYLEGLN